MKNLTVLLLIFITFCCKAQERSSISVSYGTGNGDIGHIGFGKAEGGVSRNTDKSLNIIGINYWSETSTKNLYLETGIHYLVYKYLSISNYDMHLPNTITGRTVKVISVPLKLRYEPWNFLFLNGGLYTDIDVSEKYPNYPPKISGIGLGLGIGLQYYFKNRLGIYVNPQIDLRNMLTFSTYNSGYKLLDSHLTFGLAYRIK